MTKDRKAMTWRDMLNPHNYIIRCLKEECAELRTELAAKDQEIEALNDKIDDMHYQFDMNA